MNKVYGGWVPSKSMYTVSNRAAGVHSGTFLGKRMEKHPTSNTFSYTTGWGYNMMNDDNDCAPRCWSDATVRVARMSGTHDITVEFTYGLN